MPAKGFLRRLRLAAGAALILVAFAVLASSAQASTLFFRSEPHEERIFSTRALIKMTLIDESETTVTFRAECAAAEGGQEPAASSSAWQLVAGPGSFSQQVNEPILEYWHLTPRTTYFCRFIAAGGGQEARQTESFTTNPVARPEFTLAPYQATGTGGFFEELPRNLTCGATGPRSGSCKVRVESNGSETHYELGYTTTSNPAWNLATSGSISVAEDYRNIYFEFENLKPEETYLFSIRASNAVGERTETDEPHTTPPLRPSVQAPTVADLTGTTAFVSTGVNTNGLPGRWRIEYAESPQGPWQNGPEGVVSEAEAEQIAQNATLYGDGGESYGGEITGLKAGTIYHVRVTAENQCSEFCGLTKSTERTMETAGAPTARTFLVHTLHGASLHVLGAVNPRNLPTSEIQTVTVEGNPSAGFYQLSFEGKSTGGSARGNLTEGSSVVTGFRETAGTFVKGEAVLGAGLPAGTTVVEAAPGKERLVLSAPAAEGDEDVALTAGLSPRASDQRLARALGQSFGFRIDAVGPIGGPYALLFLGEELSGRDVPQMQADASGLSPAGAVGVATVQQGGTAYDTKARFEYVPRSIFEQPGAEGGFAQARATPFEDLGIPTAEEDFVGADLPAALSSGEEIVFRISAESNGPGNPVVLGEPKTLTVPTPTPVEPAAECPNEGVRDGLAAHLPQCRAYEQVTPREKGEAREIFSYGGGSNNALNGISGAVIGADGAHVMYSGPRVKWGSDPDSGQSPYFFTRSAGGWTTKAGAPQPEAGVYEYSPQALAPIDLSQVGLFAYWGTSAAALSPSAVYKAGPPGGPYAEVATIPKKSSEVGEGWLGGSGDGSKLILATDDRKLTSLHSTTEQGKDLYEWSGGQLHQLNVKANGRPIGRCGAVLANSGAEGESPGAESSAHAISSDGRYVFFYAFIGTSCPTYNETEEDRFKPEVGATLFVRIGGSETAEVGEYRFFEASPDGSEVLVEHDGQNLLIRTNELTSQEGTAALEAVSPDFRLSGQRFVFGETNTFSGIPSLPTGADELDGFVSERRGGTNAVGETDAVSNELFGTRHNLPDQVVRYDMREHLLECLSCASPFDPEPQMIAVMGTEKPNRSTAGTAATYWAPDGSYAFFDTPAALLPTDVDGEIAPEPLQPGPGYPVVTHEFTSSFYSTSSDVYEWRRQGLDGCEAPQGCISLISGGRGGIETVLLGVGAGGRDVFFATREALLPRDDDTASDIYDARIAGGFPEPVAPVECEGDACANPAPTPGENTPSSLLYSGPGNPHSGKNRGHRKRHHHRRKRHHNRTGGHR